MLDRCFPSGNNESTDTTVPITISEDEEDEIQIQEVQDQRHPKQRTTTPKQKPKLTMIPAIPPPPLSDIHGEARRLTMSPKSQAGFALEQWNKASGVLRNNPGLMTQRVLVLALQRQPPERIVRFMISVNPKAASVLPKHGPTPLQVAVRHRASVPVVRALLEACPFALCVTNPDNALDPLTFAKRYRSTETELIELLSRPIGYWVTQSNRENERNPDTSVKSFSEETRVALPVQSKGVAQSLVDEAISSRKQVLKTIQQKSSKSDSKSKKSGKPEKASSSENKEKENKKSRTMRTRPIDRQELNNVKTLCAQLLKNHRRMARRMEVIEERLGEVNLEKESVLKSMEKQQMQHFFHQLLALEMKERNMRAHVTKVHDQCLEAYDDRVQDLSNGLDQWKSQAEAKFGEWQQVLDRERKMNSHFRNDLTEWMEYQSHQTTVTPFVYATPLGELGEDTPLIKSDSNSMFLRHYIEKKGWKPFRHWDHIRLREEE